MVNTNSGKNGELLNDLVGFIHVFVSVPCNTSGFKVKFRLNETKLHNDLKAKSC